MTAHEFLVELYNRMQSRGRAAFNSPGTAARDGEGCLLNHAGMILADESGNHAEFTVCNARIEAMDVVAEIVGVPTHMDLAPWNDRSTDEEVFAVVQKAIARTAPAPVDLPMRYLCEVAPEFTTDKEEVLA